MPGLRDILEAATPPEHGEDTWEQKQAWDRSNEASHALAALAPELAALCLDMGEALAEIRQNGRPDFGDCGAPTCEHPGCLYTRAFDALLARLSSLGSPPVPQGSPSAQEGEET